LSVFFYNIFLWLFKAAIHIASLFNPKAKKWVQGRKGVFEKLEAAIPPGQPVIWIHCASLGEFEQGRPLLEQLKAQYPAYKILLTFFSPSGYEAQKNYTEADWIFYLPADGPRNAKRFLEIVHPSLIIFVKYEFWYYYLKKIKYRNIPLLLVSALFRKDMSFFKWYGSLQRKMLSRFDHLFVQTEASQKLMQEIGLEGISSVSGDTRFDRVVEIASRFTPIPVIEQFIGPSKTIVAGSTWPEDEIVLQKLLTQPALASCKLIIAPHEINEKHLASLKELFPGAVLFSALSHGTTLPAACNCLIVDNIGMLSRLYSYAHFTYVGGGIRSMGVHNVLEAAVYHKIVFFGPFYHKYSEAVALVQSGGGVSFADDNGIELQHLTERLLTDEEEYRQRSRAAGDYVQAHKGATQKIIQFIQEKRLLTN
jgi:3-deoxy-D-manno-octulosonic-acid transferase